MFTGLVRPMIRVLPSSLYDFVRSYNVAIAEIEVYAPVHRDCESSMTGWRSSTTATFQIAVAGPLLDVKHDASIWRRCRASIAPRRTFLRTPACSCIPDSYVWLDHYVGLTREYVSERPVV